MYVCMYVYIYIYIYIYIPRYRISNLGRVKNFQFHMSPRTVMGPTQPPFQWVPRLFPREGGGKAGGV
jgi:hypothetical protein